MTVSRSMPDNFRPVYTRTLWAPFSRIFPAHSEDLIHQRVARVIVLYEDLRLEVFGISADQEQIPRLDISGYRYRELYFIRRAMITLNEFTHAIYNLQSLKSFKQFKRAVGRNGLEPWQQAVE